MASLYPLSKIAGLTAKASRLTPRAQILDLQKAMANAESYEEWLEIAWALDRLEGNEAWRADPVSPHYDHELISEHLHMMRTYRETFRLNDLRRLIEESLHRNLGDLSNQALYEYSYVGTKDLITEYLDEVERTFDWLCDTPLPGYPDELKLSMLKDAMRVFGRSALLLSGGGALGLFHLGVVKALWQQGLLPKVISGASMGAIIAGSVCAKTDDELSEMWQNIDQIHRRAVEFHSLKGMVQNRSLLDPKQLEEHVETNLGDRTFLEAYSHSGRILNIAVSPTRHRQKPRLLTHLTAPDVLIASAATASSSLPALFPPQALYRRKRSGQIEPYVGDERWVDGSLHGDVPTMRLGRLHNVNHYIVSQANPHVLPFAKLERSKGMVPTAVELAMSGAQAQSRHMLNLARRRLDGSLWRQPLEWAHGLMHQDYTGDINIHPHIYLSDYKRLMKNPSLDELHGYILSGERATWPKLAMVRDQTRLSRVMDRCKSRIIERIKSQL